MKCEIIDECNPVPEMMAMEFLPGVEYTDLLADHVRHSILQVAGTRSSLSIAHFVVEKKDSAYL